MDWSPLSWECIKPRSNAWAPPKFEMTDTSKIYYKFKIIKYLRNLIYKWKFSLKTSFTNSSLVRPQKSFVTQPFQGRKKNKYEITKKQKFLH